MDPLKFLNLKYEVLQLDITNFKRAFKAEIFLLDFLSKNFGRS